jgi:hypothetical protein
LLIRQVPDQKVRAVVRKSSPRNPTVADDAYGEAVLKSAANQLFAAVNPALPENQYFTDFAKEKLSWIISERLAT